MRDNDADSLTMDEYRTYKKSDAPSVGEIVERYASWRDAVQKAQANSLKRAAQKLSSSRVDRACVKSIEYVLKKTGKR
jgi:hypothetical protein